MNKTMEKRVLCERRQRTSFNTFSNIDFISIGRVICILPFFKQIIFVSAKSNIDQLQIRTYFDTSTKNTFNTSLFN